MIYCIGKYSKTCWQIQERYEYGMRILLTISVIFFILFIIDLLYNRIDQKTKVISNFGIIFFISLIMYIIAGHYAVDESTRYNSY